MALVKAYLEVVQGRNKGLKVAVHFNPQSLQVSYQTTGVTGAEASVQQLALQEVPAQRTGFGSTLSLDLVFDTTQSGQDVRNTTLDLARMIQPGVKDNNNANITPSIPIVRFCWGTFLFNGNIQSLNETLEFFSEQGIPLRATVSLSMNEVALDSDTVNNQAPGTGTQASTGPAIGTTPLTMSQAGDSLQGLSGRAGVGNDWKAIARANNIDNPRLLATGTILNLNIPINVTQ
ncbi:CIS tube protein [Dictyobacter formicarum]|uniref:Peptidase M23 n=1 Tax=Dictyobacter formicarum TaxID=2778368 RepID=A0ABQ3VN20_9CHLR|nr:LysM peptidoglycan-binding domain-containing protein [Dictyobacter formicarum]GHO87627.1 peptidase M23 [Dictyobacter formicarum]